MIETFKNITPTLGKNTWVHERAVVIGDTVLGDDVSVWPCAVIRGDVNQIRIGNRTNVQDGAVLHVTHISEQTDGHALNIGDDVTVGHQATLHGCTIGNRVLIGMGATVLDGAIIPDDIIIGAGALISMNKTLESGYLYLGSPAKRIRKLSQEEIDFLPYSAEHYAKLKDGYE